MRKKLKKDEENKEKIRNFGKIEENRTKKIGKLGVFLFLKLRSGDFFFLLSCIFLLQLWFYFNVFYNSLR